MARSERCSLWAASVGLVLSGVGVMLPWAAVGRVDRTGPELANLFLSLSVHGLPNGLRWLGLLWYSCAIGALLAWAAIVLGIVRGRWLAGGLLAIPSVGVLIFALLASREIGIDMHRSGLATFVAGMIVAAAAPWIGARMEGGR